MMAKRLASIAVPQIVGRLGRAVLVAALATSVLAGCSEQNFERSQTLEKQTSAGKPLVLHLEGKPKMGYFWRLNRNESSGLELVEIDRMGWTFDTAPRGSGSFTKPGTLRYAVHAKKAGTARLVFEYFRKEPGASPSASWIYQISILPGSSSGN